MAQYMDDYNYHDWSKFMVREPKEKPKGPHFAGILFDKHYESSGRDDDGSYGRYAVPSIIYFAFPDQETLKQWALRAAKDKKEFFCFEVKKLANVQLVLDIDLELK
jgi:hypothetical protein